MTIERTIRRLTGGSTEELVNDPAADHARRIAALGAEPAVERAVLRMLRD